MRAAVQLALALTLLAGCGSGAQFTVRDPSGSVTPAPASGARFEAAKRELEELVGHPVKLQIDASLLSNDLASFTEEYARTFETVVAALRWVNREQPDAFERVGKKVTEIDVRYDATIDEPAAKLDGTVVFIRTAADLARHDLGDALAWALRGNYVEDDGAKLFAMDPRQVPLARHEAYFTAITHQSTYDSKKTDPPDWDPTGEIVSSDARGRSLRKVIAFYPLIQAEKLRRDAAKHIADETLHYVLSPFERTREIALRAPDDSELRRTQKALAAFLGRELARLPEPTQERLARALFPHDDAAASAAFAGFDRIGYALGLAKQVFAPKAPPPTDLQDDVVCPYAHGGSDGRLDRNRSCNAGFYAAAAHDDASRKRLARFLTESDPRATETAFANLAGRKEAPVLALLHDVEADAKTRTVALRTLGDARSDDREELRKEGFALYTRRADARGAALYLILGTEPYQGLAAVSLGLTPKLGPAELRDLLAVGPRAVDFVATSWKALPFAKAAVVGPYLRPDTKTDVVLSLAKAACEEGKPTELASLRSSMENAARGSAESRSRYDGALEMIRPQACPPPAR